MGKFEGQRCWSFGEEASKPVILFRHGEPAFIPLGEFPALLAANVSETVSEGSPRKDYEPIEAQAQFANVTCDSTGRSRDTATMLGLNRVMFKGIDEAGAQCFEWIVLAKDLDSKNQLVVSPKFDIAMAADCQHKFTLTVFPQLKGTSRRARSFKKANGHVGLQLKCEDPSESNPRLSLAFAIRGEATSFKKHDFAERSVCEANSFWNIPKGDDKIVPLCVKVLPVAPES